MLIVFFNGAEQRNSTMYFYDINRCLYFANRMNTQNSEQGSKYEAICKLTRVDENKTQVYQ